VLVVEPCTWASALSSPPLHVCSPPRNLLFSPALFTRAQPVQDTVPVTRVPGACLGFPPAAEAFQQTLFLAYPFLCFQRSSSIFSPSVFCCCDLSFEPAAFFSFFPHASAFDFRPLARVPPPSFQVPFSLVACLFCSEVFTLTARLRRPSLTFLSLNWAFVFTIVFFTRARAGLLRHPLRLLQWASRFRVISLSPLAGVGGLFKICVRLRNFFLICFR